MGLSFGRSILRLILRLLRRRPTHEYTQVSSDPNAVELAVSNPHAPGNSTPTAPKPLLKRAKLPFRSIWTRNVLCTFLTHGLLALHLGAFNNLYFLFLSTPRFDSSRPEVTPRSLPFHFTGGLGLSPPTIGFAVGILGAIGLTLQFGVYSRITHAVGILGSFRYSLLFFPITYAFSPYLAVLPTSSPPPHAADGPLLWVVICILLFIQVLARTFSLPSTQILINNCTPHPSTLGTVHGFAQSVSAGARTFGPLVWSALYGVGLKMGVVGLAWWILSAEAILAALSSQLQYEGSGHEIWLEGEEEDQR